VTETYDRASARTESVMKPEISKPGISVWPALVIATALVAGVVPARAQDYPSRPITVIVPFPAGGASDVVARIVTNQMSRILGQSIIIENVSGAGGTVGSARAAAAPPDGYTLLAAAMGSHVAAPVLTPNVKYDPVVDFLPIGITAHSPAVVIARKDFPARDLKEFVAVLRQKGDVLQQAHGGIGASSHMACLLFTEAVGAKPTLVAYRGSGPALNDLVGGHVDFMCEQSVSVAESVLAGSVKAYAVSAAERLATLPDVPTAKESGFNYEMSVWAGLFARKGTPPEVIAKLADALDKTFDEPVVRETLAKLGGSIPAKAERNPAAFDRFVRSEIARWAPILAAIRAESNATDTSGTGTKR
jgi:tripartite-type tricarboxylate transporter receptor subunit TctC